MSSGNIYGMFVGVNRYESEDIRPLAFASADVLAVRDKLAEKFCLDTEKTIILADGVPGGKAPTRREILRAMNRFAGAPMGPEDAFFLVFAGHGFVCAGKTFLATADSEIGSEALLRETAVSLDSIRDFLAEIKAGQHVVILDACRDAPVKGTRSVGGTAVSADMTRDIGAVIRSEQNNQTGITRAKAILCSCWEGQVAYEYPQGGHGWFCHNLLVELDVAGSPTISLADLHSRVKQRMKESAWRLLPSAKDQLPHLLIEGDVPILRGATETAMVIPPPIAPTPTVIQRPQVYCAVCGTSAKEDSFRCTRCGSVCCLKCRNERWKVCAKCAQAIEARAKRPSEIRPEPTRPRVIAQFVKVSSGNFLYGKKRQQKALPDFQAMSAPVTCGQYAQFLKETGYKPEGTVVSLLSSRPVDHPVGNVSFADAVAFARWLGAELPTEEQWEKAARGEDGRDYPWGNEFDPVKCDSVESGIGHTVSVTDIPMGRSPYGCAHTVGNVWEWTSSWYGDAKTEKVVRGGSYLEDRKSCTCYYHEGMDPQFFKPDLGFRCVKAHGETTHGKQY
jgi:serine/threonine-protein kinase